jgi:hypothetical protein
MASGVIVYIQIWPYYRLTMISIPGFPDASVVLRLVPELGLEEPNVDPRYYRVAGGLVKISHQINDIALFGTGQSRAATAPSAFTPSAAPGLDLGGRLEIYIRWKIGIGETKFGEQARACSLQSNGDRGCLRIDGYNLGEGHELSIVPAMVTAPHAVGPGHTIAAVPARAAAPVAAAARVATATAPGATSVHLGHGTAGKKKNSHYCNPD